MVRAPAGIQMDASYPVAKDADVNEANGHYNHPPCQADEMQARLSGSGGVLCAPSCHDGSCPTDVPAGTTATAQCVLQDGMGNRYCALVCTAGEELTCPQGAQCTSLGICVFPEEESNLPEFMAIPSEMFV